MSSLDSKGADWVRKLKNVYSIQLHALTELLSL